MSSNREVEDRFDRLRRCERIYEDGKYLIGEFQEGGDYILVHSEKGGFNILTGTDEDAVDSIDAFVRNFPESGVMLYSEGDEHYWPLSQDVNPSEMPEVKYVGDTYGVVWHNKPGASFPDRDYVVAVYSNNQEFKYSMDSAEVIGDVFPQLNGIDEHDPVLDEAMTLATIDMEKWE